MRRTLLHTLAALGAFVALAAALPVRAESWIDAVRPWYLRPGETAPARAAPFVPRESERANVDSRALAERGPADVREDERHAFVPLHQGAIFGYEPQQTIRIPPRANIHEGGPATPGFRLRPNAALYGTPSPTWGEGPFARPLGGYSLSPRVLNFESRRR